MWNREESPRTGRSDNLARASSTGGQDTAPEVVETPAGAKTERMARLGSSVVVKGELTGSEDLIVDGRIEGRIDLPDHALTIGPNANVQADIAARIVTVF